MKRSFSTSYPSDYLPILLLIVRVGVAALMLTHGYPKLMKLLGGDFAFRDPIVLGSGTSLVLAVLAEVVCSLLILIGAGTRLATIPLLFTMVVAAFIAHGSDPFGKKELPLLYMLMYLVLLVMGNGKYSVDHMVTKKILDQKQVP
ncbi:DoxX family protein [Telluribacter humicola]|uniref:DoxX family protein n=1 Tax=Telluribacter humicola TaxID=1720261 RepID=UPI001A9654FE|nr:DoxX family protein [Telluribacter humicola]